MQRVKESITYLGDVAKFNGDMLDLFVADAVNMHSNIVKKNRQVNHLEEKLGSIHSVDFKAQHDVGELRKKLGTLK